MVGIGKFSLLYLKFVDVEKKGPVTDLINGQAVMDHGCCFKINICILIRF